MLRSQNKLWRNAMHSEGGRLQLNPRVFAKQVSFTSKVFSSPHINAGAEKVVLYSYWQSSCSWRVRIALNYKGVPYEIRAIDLMKAGGENHNDEYTAINPMKVVPTLQIDGRSIIESVAIMHYLEETRPHPHLLPSDVFQRAKVREIVEIICSGIQPLQNVGVLKYFETDKRRQWAQQWIIRGFCALEEILANSARKYCSGDEITMADCCLLPQVFNARRYHVDMSSYSIISRIESELLKVSAFSDSHPHKQPDCPNNS